MQGKDMVIICKCFQYNWRISRCFVKKIQGVSKKRYFSDFLSYFSSRGRILLFHMCFGIRILSPFHLAIQKVSIQNLNCPKNACADMIFIPALRSEDWAGIKIMSAHAFLGQLRFWMDTFWIARWNGLKILIPKHMWKSKIRPLELKSINQSMFIPFINHIWFSKKRRRFRVATLNKNIC